MCDVMSSVSQTVI